MELKEIKVNGEKIDLGKLDEFIYQWNKSSRYISIKKNPYTLPNKVGVYEYLIVVECEDKLYRIKPFMIEVTVPEKELKAYEAFDDYQIRKILHRKKYANPDDFFSLPHDRFAAFIKAFPMSKYASTINSHIWSSQSDFIQSGNQRNIEKMLRTSLHYSNKEKIKSTLQSSLESKEHLLRIAVKGNKASEIKKYERSLKHYKATLKLLEDM